MIVIKNIAGALVGLLANYWLPWRLLDPFDDLPWPYRQLPFIVVMFAGFVWADWKLWPQVKNDFARTSLRLSIATMTLAALFFGPYTMARAERDEKETLRQLSDDAPMFIHSDSAKALGDESKMTRSPNQVPVNSPHGLADPQH